jgi:TRAP-type C4-dicarboxylate transport system substrate-binding protein
VIDQITLLRRIKRMLATLVLPLIALLSAPGSASAQQFTMKFATQTQNDVQHEYIKVYKRELEQATSNRIKVEIYPASQLGGAPRQTEGVRLGTIEAAIGPPELFVGADPRLQVPALAGLFRDREHMRRLVRLPDFRKAIFDVTAARGMVGMSYVAYDMQSFVFKAPVAKLADFSGKRIRVLASEGEQSAVAALGGASVPMSLPEVLPALQQGTIDGVNSVIGVFVTFRYHDAAQNLLDTSLWGINSLALVSKIFYDRLPPDLQKTVLETGQKIEPELEKWQIERIASDAKAWAERGGKTVKLSPEEQQEAVRRVSASAQAVVAKSAPLKDLYDRLRTISASVN